MTRPCPNCHQPASLDKENPARPFCSERCHQLDLARWLDGEYVIPGPPSDQVQEEVEPD